MKVLGSIATALYCWTAGVNAQILDIPALLAGLGPAPITDSRFHSWKPPGKDDVRAPCPGLNSLANHGFLNRNGKNITIVQLLEGGAAGMNIGPDFMTLIGAAGLLSSPNPAQGHFDLDDLDRHNFPIEHDVSLSRQDHYFGNWYDFNNGIWQGTLSYFSGLAKTTTLSAAKARYARVKNCVENNPECVYGERVFVFSSGETGLYVQTMSSPLTNSAPLSYVKSLFQQQKLPVDLGWKPSAVPITFPTLGAYIVELFAANPDKFAEVQDVTQGLYAQTFVDLVGGASALSNLTMGISDYLHFPGK